MTARVRTLRRMCSRTRQPSRMFVYVLFAEDDTVLYVGITNDTERRFAEHAVDKPWARDVAQVNTIPFASRRSALIAEACMIEALEPIHNLSRPLTTKSDMAWTIAFGLDHGIEGLVACWEDHGTRDSHELKAEIGSTLKSILADYPGFAWVYGFVMGSLR